MSSAQSSEAFEPIELSEPSEPSYEWPEIEDPDPPDPEPEDKDQCAECLRPIIGEPPAWTRESTGFGMENYQDWYFCSDECRARWLGIDPVLEKAPQATFSYFTEGPEAFWATIRGL